MLPACAAMAKPLAIFALPLGVRAMEAWGQSFPEHAMCLAVTKSFDGGMDRIGRTLRRHLAVVPNYPAVLENCCGTNMT